MSKICGTCRQPGVQLSWEQMTASDQASFFKATARPSHNPYLHMASLGFQVLKFAATRLELTKVYECRKCNLRWRVFLE
jgi:hypothetical protein